MRVNTDQTLCWGVDVEGGIRCCPFHQRYPRFPGGCLEVEETPPKGY